MPTTNKAIHHQHVRKRMYKKHEPYPSPNTTKWVIDHLIYAVALLVPVMTIPQLLQIWQTKNAAGVSLVSWSSFSVFSFIWFVYGVIHRDKPLMLMNLSLTVLQLFISVGIYLYG